MSQLNSPVRRIHGRLARYALTAGLAAIVDFGGFVLLITMGMNVAPAAAASFLVATIVNYTLTARFVFSVVPSLRRYPRFLAAASIGFLINVGVTFIAHALGAAPEIAKITGIGTAFLANFGLNATLVFPGGSAGSRDSNGER